MDIEKTNTSLDLLVKSLKPEFSKRNGSEASALDYKTIFKFASEDLDITKTFFLVWSKEKFACFTSAVRPLLNSYLQRIIVLANSKTAKEVSSVQLLHQSFLEEIMELTFSENDRFLLDIGPWSYDKVRMMNFEYSGKTDLSIIHQRIPISLGGFETKISSVKLTKKTSKTGLEFLNAEGIKAVSQAGTQILGSSNSLDAFMIPNIAISTIATNGVSWIFTRRNAGADGAFMYWHYTPITLAHQDIEGMWHLKDDSDICYDQICHILGLFLDNVDYLMQGINRMQLISVFPKLVSIKEDSNEDDENGPNDDTDDCRDDNDNMPGAAARSCRNLSSGGGQRSKSSALSSSTNKKKDLGVRSMNVLKHVGLTEKSLIFHNALFSHWSGVENG